MAIRVMQFSGGYRYLFLSLLALLVVYPVLSNVERATPWIDVIVYLVMVAGIFAARSNHRQLIVATVLGILAFIFLHLADVVSAEWVLVTSYILGIAFFGYLAIHILRDIL